MRINCSPTPRQGAGPDPDDIDKIVSGMTAGHKIIELYLFGSAAENRMTAMSDIDLAVAVPHLTSDKSISNPIERVENRWAAERRRQHAIERTARKTAGWHRAIDIFFVAPGEIADSTPGDGATQSIATRGITLVSDGESRRFSEAVEAGPPFPNRDTTSLETDQDRRDQDRSLQTDTWNTMRSATLRAGRKMPSATERHRIAHMAARAVLSALHHAIILSGREPETRSDHHRLDAQRTEHSGKIRPIREDRLTRLARHHRRWRFAGEPTPTMTDALQAVYDAAGALDTIPAAKGGGYYPRDAIARLEWNLIRQYGRWTENRETEFPRILKAEWPSLLVD